MGVSWGFSIADILVCPSILNWRSSMTRLCKLRPRRSRIWWRISTQFLTCVLTSWNNRLSFRSKSKQIGIAGWVCLLRPTHFTSALNCAMLLAPEQAPVIPYLDTHPPINHADWSWPRSINSLRWSRRAQSKNWSDSTFSISSSCLSNLACLLGSPGKMWGSW